MTSTKADRALIRQLNGFFTSLLTPEEQESFVRCIHDGYAKQDFDHAAGLLGVSKVKWIQQPHHPTHRPSHD